MRLLKMAALAAVSLAAAAPAMANNHAAHAHGDHAHGDHSAHTEALSAVLAHDRRDADRARDEWRNPAETLTFFQVEPGMTVVDYMPSSGWYSRILIPYLGAEGIYVGLNPELAPHLTGFWDSMRGTAERLPAQAQEWTGGEGASVIGANTDDDLTALSGSVDRVLIFREMHNIRRMGWTHNTMLALRDMLKEGGMVGVVQHRAKADAPVSYTFGANGYQREEDVIRLFSMYGFDLVESSEINANPADPANWEMGVWTLPPGFRGTPATDTVRRAELSAIGESDRMTLLFRKQS